MQIENSQQGAWIVLSLAGAIDHAGADQLRAALSPLTTGGAVALDFGRVDYITSAGFRVLMTAEREQRTKQGKFMLGNMSPELRRFFDIAGLTPVFTIATDLGGALSETR
jgi:anti-anti-sigma factor